MKKILVTGGTGFIGSHTTIKLLEANFDVVILDNLSNSSDKIIDKIKYLAKKDFLFIKGDIRDKNILKIIFSENKIDSVLHFAGLKAAGESEKYPIKYYENNVLGSINLFKEMSLAGVNSIIFSSSATVYGEPKNSKCDENSHLSPINVYGKSKLIIENILKDIKKSEPFWKIVNLRYFNPIGAHPSGIIGEDPKGEPNNLLPFITQVAVGRKDKLLIFGNDYRTKDGTGRRDYIHVQDLADGHLAALHKLMQEKECILDINLGTGISHSVLEIISAFEKACGKKIPYEFTQRRTGDIAELCADPSFARDKLGWKAKKNIEQMCKDAWRWQVQNPNGFNR
ncbi:UDP-glucose 4-epimerase GalE [uncultured Prochlorococcus sp.]|uniref:UDP-glucose 4-epimerase GalE n=1 Tax=uncultured Prochlorococcus sp. TaxID=159733 RepID=UPI0025883C54|nr:UDP-glucose 4-epimerase GalE [uncultured Prochlorococcus sp.]